MRIRNISDTSVVAVNYGRDTDAFAEQVLKKFLEFVSPEAKTSDGKNLLKSALARPMAMYEAHLDQNSDNNQMALAKFLRELLKLAMDVHSQSVVVKKSNGLAEYQPFFQTLRNFFDEHGDDSISVTYKKAQLDPRLAQMNMVYHIIPWSQWEKGKLERLLDDSMMLN